MSTTLIFNRNRKKYLVTDDFNVILEARGATVGDHKTMLLFSRNHALSAVRERWVMEKEIKFVKFDSVENKTKFFNRLESIMEKYDASPVLIYG